MSAIIIDVCASKGEHNNYACTYVLWGRASEILANSSPKNLEELSAYEVASIMN